MSIIIRNSEIYPGLKEVKLCHLEFAQSEKGLECVRNNVYWESKQTVLRQVKGFFQKQFQKALSLLKSVQVSLYSKLP